MKIVSAGIDTFGWSLTTSVIFHLFIVLGISFVLPDPSESSPFSPPLQITLVSTFSEDEPDDAEILAQANSLGEEGASNLTPPASEAQQSASSESQAQQDDVMTSNQPDPAQVASLDAREAIEPALNRDELAAEINLAWLNSQSSPREKYVSAQTKEWQHAAYIERWRMSVERVGNLNYPEAAKQQKIEGSLVLDVAIRADGSVRDVKLFRSSGHKMLDDAAERIVSIAGPFQPFTTEMRAELDVLHIVRTWDFGQNRGFSTNPGDGE